MKLSSAGLATFTLPSLAAVEEMTLNDVAQPTKLAGLLHNEDCTGFFAHQDFPAGRAGEVVDNYVDMLADAGVSVLLCNTNSRRTNYRSKVWEAFWDGYDPIGTDDQPFLSTVPSEQRKNYRKWVGNMLAVHNEGVDYPARVIQRCRARHIAPWLSVRMNDVHHTDNLDHPFHSALWRKPELFRQGHPGHFARALDFAHEEVRNHYQGLIIEMLEGYDLDGLELDFLREPYLFSKDKEQEGRQVLTTWLREIRTLADAAAKRLGHTVMLGVRVPSTPDAALGLGFDTPAWVREGLVDLVVVAPRWATLEFDMPLSKWRELVGDQVTLAGGLEALYRPHPAAAPHVVTPEEATGAAVAVLAGGADVVYLFNSQPAWPLPKYRSVFKAFSSLDELLRLPRRHSVTYRDVTSLTEVYRSPLPASGTQLAFSMQLGPAPESNWKIETTVQVAALVLESKFTDVFINGIAGKLLRTEVLKNGNLVVTHAFPVSALSDSGRDTIVLEAAGKTPVTAQLVEVSLQPPMNGP